ncbi:MAG TPA: hypothetical protein VK752_22425 [Bryobacteraceae bacterium]|jgi:hypothetical protein|nr:hypothetical protein [Bryobacteraceae bacterium]
MKQILMVVVLALSGSALADSISSATGSFSPFPTTFNTSTPAWAGAFTPPATTGTPFWNNPSDDTGAGGSHMMNIGYVLNDDGGLEGTLPVLGSDTVSEDLVAAGGADPTAFDFISNATADYLSLLFAQSSLDTGNPVQGTVFGYYVGSTYTPLYTPVDTTSPTGMMTIDPATPGNSYGFYATVCYGPGVCETYTTGNGNFGNAPGAPSWNHFALFLLASGNYAMGFTAADAMVGESLGDYNDIVIELQAIPEPQTIGMTVLGLLGLIAFRYRALFCPK